MSAAKPEHRNDPITVGGVTVAPGRKVRLDLPFARLVTGSRASLPVSVVNGRTAGPQVWLSGAIHGDELNGVEIVRRVLARLDARRLRGAVIAVPIVNPLGFAAGSRYLPDRRDLNRSFPGSRRGSTASRLAYLFRTEIVEQCSFGIDLHTATNHRINLPQVRADCDDPETVALAKAFGAPFTIHARVRDGSLRQTAADLGIKVLIYEAGQAHSFDEDAIELGVNGVLRSLRSIGLIDERLPRPVMSKFIRRTRWLRSRRGGLVNIDVALGQHVVEGDVMARVSDAFGTRPTSIRSQHAGWVIARTLNPIVSPGDALVHLASSEGPDRDEPAEMRRR